MGVHPPPGGPSSTRGPILHQGALMDANKNTHKHRLRKQNWEQPHAPKSLWKCNGTANWNGSVTVTHTYKRSPDPKVLGYNWAHILTKTGDKDDIGGRETPQRQKDYHFVRQIHTQPSLALYQMLSLTLTKSKGLAVAVTPQAGVQRRLRAKVVRWRYVKVIQEAQQVSSASWHQHAVGSLLWMLLKVVWTEKKTQRERFKEENVFVIVRPKQPFRTIACVNNTILGRHRPSAEEANWTAVIKWHSI